MPIPDDVNTTNIDEAGDDPRQWRVDGLDHMQKFNELLGHLRTPGHVGTDDLSDGSVTLDKMADDTKGYVHVGENQDLNTYVNAGRYAVDGSGQQNGPLDDPVAIYLDVMRRYSLEEGWHDHIEQRATPQMEGEEIDGDGPFAWVYVRRSEDGGATWGAWHLETITDEYGTSLEGDTLRLTYHKARSAWHVSAFNNKPTAVGGGNASVDSAALQAALDSQEIVDITGKELRINQVINVGYPGATLGSTIPARRVGTRASSRIVMTDPEQTRLFNCTSTNFEAYGFYIEGNGNDECTLFHFQRPDGSASDIDAVLQSISANNAGKLFHIYGRGLRVDDVIVANGGFGDLDWPADWTPSGSTNDTQVTGMRAYHFSNIRMHGTDFGLRNIGANAANCRGLLFDGCMLDIGGSFFRGLAVEAVFSDINYNIAATVDSVLFDLYPGSYKSTFSGIRGGGIQSGGVTRLPRNIIKISCVDAPVDDLNFIGGNLGPCNRDAVQIAGNNRARNISFVGFTWDRSGLEGSSYSPIAVFNNNGTLQEASVKLVACNFRFDSGVQPNYIVGGTNTANITVYRDPTTTKLSSAPWAQSSVTLVE